VPDDLVSVVVPTYNRAYCVRQAVDSALAQTYKHVEVLLIDDGSTDSTKALIGQAYCREPRVKYSYQENAGVSAARNHAIRVAQGEYVAFLDSDDEWKPWKLELQIRCLEYLSDAGMIWSDMEAVDPNENVVSDRYLRKMYSAYQWFRSEDLFPVGHSLKEITGKTPTDGDGKVYVGDIFSQMIMGNLVHTSTVVLRRERLNKVVGFNEALKVSGEDYDFHLRTCKEGPVAFLDLPTIRYRVDLPDALTKPANNIYVALNNLRTIEPMIKNEGSRINLPKWMINLSLAEANAWVGQCYTRLGQMRDARSYFMKSIQYRLWQPRIWALGVVSCLPASIGEGVRHGLRRIRKRSQQR